ncbi:PA0069 family radical SAM protein [Thauera sp. CAU 1555]|uniref:PA0069 family radical SAM protein n=1 Tax=Thauera sedimentorum TaxID=2767595 RepID=A0ABR9B7H2_9RHOO|nr:PA0069 family radical SAM protein [Thauera sedimentorum]MBC9070447.1 PA0069 family radical SAM protein [Thauera sedimentorum]MBD8501367.1 PA0069 family radical SAM protein [Thauera sedimentorum]
MTVRIFSYPANSSGAPRGRGSASSPHARFLTLQHEPAPDEAGCDASIGPVQTRLSVDHARSVLSYNRSPDLPFDRAINPYRGCEHGCIYCYARPSHAYLDLSPGLDFETELFFKPDAPALLRRELSHPRYRCAPIALGSNTDPWQPVERRTGLTRRLLELLLECRHPLAIVTKSTLIERDLDLLREFARDRLVRVTVSVTTLDDALARRLEPRAPRGARRLETIAALRAAGVPVGVFFAPLIPALNDQELEAIVAAAHAAGADQAAHVLLRLPGEVKGLFEDWLQTHYPARAAHVLSVLSQCRNGQANDPRFGHRMRGSGPFAQLYSQRMERVRRQLGMSAPSIDELRRDLFRPPAAPADANMPVQGSLF